MLFVNRIFLVALVFVLLVCGVYYMSKNLYPKDEEQGDEETPDWYDETVQETKDWETEDCENNEE